MFSISTLLEKTSSQMEAGKTSAVRLPVFDLQHTEMASIVFCIFCIVSRAGARQTTSIFVFVRLTLEAM